MTEHDIDSDAALTKADAMFQRDCLRAEVEILLHAIREVVKPDGYELGVASLRSLRNAAEDVAKRCDVSSLRAPEGHYPY